MHFKTLVMAFLIGLSPSAFSQQELYRVANSPASYCTQVGDARQGSGASCHELTGDQTFAIAMGLPDIPGLKQIGGISNSQFKYGYINRDVSLIKVSPHPVDYCTPDDVIGGGEIDHWVIGKDGTLKLKRFMVTSKCIDGHLKSFSKPLN
ncbi:hypothetical protein [Caballeronia sp. dw_19]|uniref:hypothetical protein n=1 Tax=Caballeronia sp. dw_19 TaxID=2719791 RepID=UPI001BCB977D|nr:hypothetical protein [Caballeronia sp. dw_19]